MYVRGDNFEQETPNIHDYWFYYKYVSMLLIYGTELGLRKNLL